MDDVIKFLTQCNRPCTTNDIMQGIEKKLSKNQVTTALGLLLGKNQIIEKNCGKQKIYCVAQNFPSSSRNIKEEVLDLEKQCTAIGLKLQHVQTELETHNEVLGKYEDTKLLMEKKQSLEEEVPILREKVTGMGHKEFDPKSKVGIEKQYKNSLQTYQKRKRLCMDMLNAILENYPKSKKDLFTDIGIETDEDVDFKLNLVK